MKTIVTLLILVCVWGCGAQKPGRVLHERQFQDEQGKIIEAKAKELVRAGRISDSEHFDAYHYLGTYAWYSGICDDAIHGPSKCSFGAYSFSPEAFRQAQRMFVVHGQMAEDSDLLIDVGSGAFDKSIVGHTVTYLTYCSLHGGKLYHCAVDDNLRDLKVVEFIDKNTVRLNQKAKWDAEGYGLDIVPPDYVDMCQCTLPSAMPPVPSASTMAVPVVSETGAATSATLSASTTTGLISSTSIATTARRATYPLVLNARAYIHGWVAK